MVVGSALIVTTMLGRPGSASAEDGDVPRPTASAAEGAGGDTGRYVDQHRTDPPNAGHESSSGAAEQVPK
jgi:hypothetical protein